jgi:GntR family transcriptional regulator
MALRREAPDPLYIQMKQTLVDEITRGRYRVHERLPSERELSETYKISRMTARQALIDLIRAGLAYTRVGKGTFVAEAKIQQQLRIVSGFSQDVRARGGRATSRVLAASVKAATPEIAAALRIMPEREVVALSRVRLDDEHPLAIEHAFLPLTRCPGLLAKHDFARESLYAALAADYGYQLSEAEQTIEAALGEPSELRLLRMRAPGAVLKIQRLTVTADSVPIEYVRSTYRGDRYKFHLQLQPARQP